MSEITTLSQYQSTVTRMIFPVDSEDFDAQIQALNDELDSLLPIESNSIEELKAIIESLELARAGYFDVLPDEHLKARKPNGEPCFAFYSVDDRGSVCQFRLMNAIRRSYGWQGQFNKPLAPQLILRHYDDMSEHIMKVADKKMVELSYPPDLAINVYMSHVFNGIIPSEVRSKIRDAQNSNLFSGIFLIAEAIEWQYDSEPAPLPVRKTDPLVVGVALDKLFLIASFDLTTVEQRWIDSATLNS